MTEEEEITQGNNLIAEFMGLEKHKNDEEFCSKWSDGEGNYFTNLVYDCSWEALMPVVTKIESLPGYNLIVEISGYLCTIYRTARDPKISQNGGFYTIHIISHKQNDKRVLVWESIVMFIQWYNKNKAHDTSRQN